jgi:hypothetical protein
VRSAIRSGCGGWFRDDLTLGHASLEGHFDLIEDRLQDPAGVIVGDLKDFISAHGAIA